jgi:hypothetical protein
MHETENNNKKIDTVIYAETQCGKKPQEMIFDILIIQGRITIANLKDTIILSWTHSDLYTHFTLTSMGLLVYITSITQLHKLIMNRSHNYTNNS